jgi:hypothetical protein
MMTDFAVSRFHADPAVVRNAFSAAELAVLPGSTNYEIYVSQGIRDISNRDQGDTHSFRLLSGPKERVAK